MAPPANRRSGYSRRAQYGTFFGYLAGVIGAIVGAGLLILSVSGNSLFTGLRTAASDAGGAPGRVVAGTRAAGSSVFEVLAGYFTYGAETARLKREVALARIRLAEQAALAEENRRLKATLALAAPDSPARPVATAWLIGSTASSTRRYATISAGSASGVRPGMPVRTALGLVGRVLEVGNHTARILLITDTDSVVPVRRASDGVSAFATGRSDGTLQLRLISLGINPLKVGDAFVTSGAGGLYWPGTPIAVVAALTRDGAIARVLSDPAASEIVVVQPQWNPVEDPSLPPPPDPAMPGQPHRAKRG